jgi:hypothetical protein
MPARGESLAARDFLFIGKSCCALILFLKRRFAGFTVLAWFEPGYFEGVGNELIFSGVVSG